MSEEDGESTEEEGEGEESEPDLDYKIENVVASVVADIKERINLNNIMFVEVKKIDNPETQIKLARENFVRSGLWCYFRDHLKILRRRSADAQTYPAFPPYIYLKKCRVQGSHA